MIDYKIKKLSENFAIKTFINPKCMHKQRLTSADLSRVFYCQEEDCMEKIIDIEEYFGVTKYKNRLKYYQTGET